MELGLAVYLKFLSLNVYFYSEVSLSGLGVAGRLSSSEGSLPVEERVEEWLVCAIRIHVELFENGLECLLVALDLSRCFLLRTLPLCLQLRLDPLDTLLYSHANTLN